MRRLIDLYEGVVSPCMRGLLVLVQGFFIPCRRGVVSPCMRGLIVLV